MPLRNPQREKSFRCRSTHFFAKVSNFSLCVGVFNKNTNTEDARKHKSKGFCHLQRTPVQQNFKQKRLASPACRAWWQSGERCIGSNMFFSSVLCVARQSKGGPGGNVRACFLVTSCHETRSNTKNRHRSARGETAQYDRP